MKKIKLKLEFEIEVDWNNDATEEQIKNFFEKNTCGTNLFYSLEDYVEKIQEKNNDECLCDIVKSKVLEIKED